MAVLDNTHTHTASNFEFSFFLKKNIKEKGKIDNFFRIVWLFV